MIYVYIYIYIYISNKYTYTYIYIYTKDYLYGTLACLYQNPTAKQLMGDKSYMYICMYIHIGTYRYI